MTGSGSCIFDASFIAQQYTALHAAQDDNSSCLNSYYVDAVAGNDANGGKSTSAAWRTIAKVNANTYNPGDCILFNRGQTWAGTKLYFTGSGNATHPIMVAAYGTGAKPVITARGSVTGWDTAANWAGQSSNVWISTFTVPINPLRAWLSGQEYVSAPSVSAIDPHYRNLDARGGGNAISVYGSSHAIIEGCAIGRDSFGGVWVDRKTWAPASDNSDYGVVRYNEIDSGLRIYDFIRRE